MFTEHGRSARISKVYVASSYEQLTERITLLAPDRLIYSGVAEVGARALSDQNVLQPFPHNTITVRSIQGQDGATLIIDNVGGLFEQVLPLGRGL